MSPKLNLNRKTISLVVSLMGLIRYMGMGGFKLLKGLVPFINNN